MSFTIIYYLFILYCIIYVFIIILLLSKMHFHMLIVSERLIAEVDAHDIWKQVYWCRNNCESQKTWLFRFNLKNPGGCLMCMLIF